MLRTFSSLESHLINSIKKYYNAPFDKDFYQWIANQSSSDEISREKIKDSFMFFLFEDNEYHRFHNPAIKEIDQLFFGVMFIINSIHEEIGKKDFARFMQLLESQLFINTILREFNELYPHIPLFTIHDAVLTIPKYSKLLQDFIIERTIQITGIPMTAKIKSPNEMEKVIVEKIDEIWKKWRNVTNEKRYLKLQRSVFASNITLGESFLNLEKSPRYYF
jgi:hypothetical protein